MKSTTFPPLHVEPSLRSAMEGVLEEGESLSNFVGKALRAQVELRRRLAFPVSAMPAAERDAVVALREPAQS